MSGAGSEPHGRRQDAIQKRYWMDGLNAGTGGRCDAVQLSERGLKHSVTGFAQGRAGPIPRLVLLFRRGERSGLRMKRQDVLLAALASARPSKAFEPVHVQKAMFLIDRRAKALFSKSKDQRYHFVPYDYGPFDSRVYHDLDQLARDGLISIDRNPEYGYRRYTATDLGREQGERALDRMSDAHRGVVTDMANFVLSLPFRALVSAIYREFPEMKANSVFKA